MAWLERALRSKTILFVQKCVCHGLMGNRREREVTIGGLRPWQIADVSRPGLGGTVLRVPSECVWACRSNRSSKRPAGQMPVGLCFI